MKKTVYFIVLTAIVHILSACSGSTLYDEYAHTPIAGWEKNDTRLILRSPNCGEVRAIKARRLAEEPELVREQY